MKSFIKLIAITSLLLAVNLMELKHSEGVMDFFENLFAEKQDNFISYNFKQI